MPIRKMSASRRPRTYRKRATGFKKAVQAITKKVINRQSETKTGVFSYATNFGTTGTSQTVWSSITTGSTQSNRIGDMIHAKGIKIRGVCQIDNTLVTANWDYATVRMLIVSAKRPLSLPADAPSWNGSIDPELFNVHSDRLLNFSTTKRAVFMNKYVKFDRKVPYSGVSPSKNELYIILIPNGVTGFTTTTGLNLNTTVQMYYKDI